MDIESVARNSINFIKDKWGLPAKGLLAGGSLANLVYNSIYTKNAPVNDIDIFILDRENKSPKDLFNFKKVEKKYDLDSYGHLTVNYKINDRYRIIESINNDIYNYILYTSSNDDYSIIIESFDLNCTKIGYIIEEDRFIIDPSFVDFIKTNLIKLDSLTTPYHSVIRLAKKASELESNVDEIEFKMLQYAIKCGFKNIIRTGFKDKYKYIFIKYKHTLEKYFNLVEDEDKILHVKQKFNIDTKIYKLDSIDIGIDDTNLIKIENTWDFLFYIRNIYGNEQKTYLWEKLRHIYNGKDIIEDFSKKNIDLLSRIIKYAPNTYFILKDLNLKDQLKLIDNTLNFFNNDYYLSISYLEKFKETNYDSYDDFIRTCIEISLRKEIGNMDYKIKNIFIEKKENVFENINEL